MVALKLKIMYVVFFHRTHSKIIPEENNSACSEIEIFTNASSLGIEWEIVHMCETQVDRVTERC